MKKSFSALAFVLAALPAAAALPEDTVVAVTRPDSVILLQSDSTVHLSIYGREDDNTYRFDYDKKFNPEGRVVTHQKTSGLDFTLPFLQSKGKRGESYFSMGGVGFGFVNALGSPGPMNVNMAASYEVFADLLTYGRYVGPNADLSLGFGINWRNYRMNGRTRFVMDGNGISLAPYPDGADIDFSRIKVFSLTFPFRYTQHLSRNFTYSLAAILNVNTYASLKTHYTLDGEKHHSVFKNIHQTPVTVDFMGQIQFHSIGLYVKYSPCRVLNTDFGPDFSHISTGITLFY